MSAVGRSDGLVQRHTGAARASENKDTTANGEQSGYDPNENYDNDKQTRLTLMEEVLLLGLKDREVILSCLLIKNDSIIAVVTSLKLIIKSEFYQVLKHCLGPSR